MHSLTGGSQRRVSSLLRDLYSPEQLEQMDAVRTRLLEDPTALDNRHGDRDETESPKL